MRIPNLPAIRACRPAWNKGRIVAQQSHPNAKTLRQNRQYNPTASDLRTAVQKFAAEVAG